MPAPTAIPTPTRLGTLKPSTLPHDTPIPIPKSLPLPPLTLSIAYSCTTNRENVFSELTAASYHFIPLLRPALRRVRLHLIPLSHTSSAHALLHKRNDEMAQTLSNPAVAPVHSLTSLAYALRSSSTAPVERLTNVWGLLDRCVILRAIHRISLPAGSATAHPLLRTHIHPLRWIQISVTESDAVIEQRLVASLVFPIILKRRLACGNDASHEMAIAYTPRAALAAIREVFTPQTIVVNKITDDVLAGRAAMDCPVVDDITLNVVAQEYIESTGGVLFKAYAVADNVAVQTRSTSLQALCDSQQNEGDSQRYIHYNPHDIKNKRERHGIDGVNVQSVREGRRPTAPSQKVAEKLVKALREDLGVDLFGVDIIFDQRTGFYSVIDVNYFPSYRGVHGAMEWILQHVCNTIGMHLEKAGV